MTASRWPAVVDALVALLRADPALAGVDVLDGPPVGEPSGRDVVCIGHVLNDDDDLSGSVRWQPHSTGGIVEEACQVRLAVQAVAGDTTLAIPRTRAFALLDAVHAALRGDWTVGGLDGVIAVDLETGSVRQDQADLGSGCRVEATVTVTSLI